MRREMTFGRVMISLALGLFALLLLSPPYTVDATSLRSLGEIQQDTALALPEKITFTPWAKAWSSARTGIDCRGPQPFILNSVSMDVPSAILSPVIGSIKGYALWQFTRIWNDLLFGVILAGPDTRPVTVELNNLVNTSEGAKEYNVDTAGALITALPTMIVSLLGGRYFARGLTACAMKG